MNRAALAAVLVAGLAAGWFGRAALEPSRPEAMLAMFTDHCLPRAVTGKDLAPEGFVPLRLGTRGTNWADPRTHLLLTLSSRSCSVSDTLDVMQMADVTDIERRVRATVAARFPQLTLDEANILGWPVFLVWHDGTPPGAKRWGVTFFHSPSPDAETMLSIKYPPSQPV